jgi:hypothetical protein
MASIINWVRKDCYIGYVDDVEEYSIKIMLIRGELFLYTSNGKSIDVEAGITNESLDFLKNVAEEHLKKQRKYKISVLLNN